MKKLITICLLLLFVRGNSQVITDPALGQISFTDLSGNAISDTLAMGYIVQLSVPIRNLDAVNSVPLGSCKLKIGLGSKIVNK